MIIEDNFLKKFVLISNTVTMFKQQQCIILYSGANYFEFYDRSIPIEPYLSAVSISLLKSLYEVCTVGRVKLLKHVSAVGSSELPSSNLTSRVVWRECICCRPETTQVC